MKTKLLFDFEFFKNMKKEEWEEDLNNKIENLKVLSNKKHDISIEFYMKK